MNSRVPLKELVERLQKKSGEDPDKIREFVHSFFQLISLDLKYNDKSSVYPFGTFKKMWVDERIQWNYFTKSNITVPAHYKISFKPMPSTAGRVNKEFAHLSYIIWEDSLTPFSKETRHPSLLRTARSIRAQGYRDSEAAAVPSLLRTARSYRSVYCNNEMISTDSHPLPGVLPAEEEEFGSLSEALASAVDVTHYYEPEKQPQKYPEQTFPQLKLLLLLLFISGVSLLLPLLFLRTHKPADPVLYHAETLHTLPDTEESTPSSPEIVPEAKAEIPRVPAFTHTAERGDSFSKLSEKYWKSRYYWPRLYLFNRDNYPDPDLIFPGNLILFPPLTSQHNRESDSLEVYFIYENLIHNEKNPVRYRKRKNYQLRTLIDAETLYPGFIERYKAQIQAEDLNELSRYINTPDK